MGQEEEVVSELAPEMTGSLEQLAGLEEEEEDRVGLLFMAQRTVCASISRSSIVHRVSVTTGHFYVPGACISISS